MTQQNFHKFFTFYFIVFGIVISLFGGVMSYILETSTIEKNINHKAKEISDIKIDTILDPSIENIDNIVKSLGTNKIMASFMEDKNDQNKKQLQEIFLAVANSQNTIMQARLIGKNGDEIIRVDRKRSCEDSFVVSDEKLQNKSTRDYFQIVSKKVDTTIWHSKIDLNIENGKIETPMKPTFRVAFSLFDKEKHFAGMVIVNIHIKEIFDAIRKSSAFDHYIIDKDHNFIFHPNEAYSFNKYRGIVRDFETDFPNGLNSKGIYSFPLGDILHNDDGAILVLKSKENYEEMLLNQKIKTSVIVFVMTILLSFILALYLSKTPVKLQKALLKAHEKLGEFTAIIDKYIITATTKKDSTIMSVSSAFEQSSGYTKEELIGRKMNIIKDPNGNRSVIADLWKTISTGQTWCGEISNRKKNGDIYWLEQHIVPTLDPKQNIETFVSLGVDITAKKELEKIASIDKLTNLYNRRMVDEFMKIELESEKRHHRGLCVIMIDIDHFKAVNDTFGHQIGDVVLAQTATVIAENTRKSDIQGRYGGEEFIVICPDIIEDDAFLLAEKIRIALKNYIFDQVGTKTISLGIGSYIDGDSCSTLIKKADMALYIAKEGGRDKTILFREDIAV